MEELIKAINEKLEEDPMFIIGQLSEILKNQHQNLIQYEKVYLENTRFHEKFFKLFPEEYQTVKLELQMEDMSNE